MGQVPPRFGMTQYHALEIFYPNCGKVARDLAPPAEQGEVEEPQSALPAFLFSPS